MNYEEKINELESRLEKLEKKEKRRTIKNRIVYSIYAAIIIGVIVVVWILYGKFKTYRDQFDSLTNWSTSLNRDNIIDGSDNFLDYFNNFFNY